MFFIFSIDGRWTTIFDQHAVDGAIAHVESSVRDRSVATLPATHKTQKRSISPDSTVQYPLVGASVYSQNASRPSRHVYLCCEWLFRCSGYPLPTDICESLACFVIAMHGLDTQFDKIHLVSVKCRYETSAQSSCRGFNLHWFSDVKSDVALAYVFIKGDKPSRKNIAH